MQSGLTCLITQYSVCSLIPKLKNKDCTLRCFTHERPSKAIGELELTSNDNNSVFS